jgi:hypothetical protein
MRLFPLQTLYTLERVHCEKYHKCLLLGVFRVAMLRRTSK